MLLLQNRCSVPADGYTAAVYFRKKRKNSKKLFGEIVRIRLHGKKDSAS